MDVNRPSTGQGSNRGLRQLENLDAAHRYINSGTDEGVESVAQEVSLFSAGRLSSESNLTYAGVVKQINEELDEMGAAIHFTKGRCGYKMQPHFFESIRTDLQAVNILCNKTDGFRVQEFKDIGTMHDLFAEYIQFAFISTTKEVFYRHDEKLLRLENIPPAMQKMPELKNYLDNIPLGLLRAYNCPTKPLQPHSVLAEFLFYAIKNQFTPTNISCIFTNKITFSRYNILQFSGLILKLRGFMVKHGIAGEVISSICHEIRGEGGNLQRVQSILSNFDVVIEVIKSLSTKNIGCLFGSGPIENIWTVLKNNDVLMLLRNIKEYYLECKQFNMKRLFPFLKTLIDNHYDAAVNASYIDLINMLLNDEKTANKSVLQSLKDNFMGLTTTTTNIVASNTRKRHLDSSQQYDNNSWLDEHTRFNSYVTEKYKELNKDWQWNKYEAYSFENSSTWISRVCNELRQEVKHLDPQLLKEFKELVEDDLTYYALSSSIIDRCKFLIECRENPGAEKVIIPLLLIYAKKFLYYEESQEWYMYIRRNVFKIVISTLEKRTI